MMELPICYYDARHKKLCPRCIRKLRNGEITEIDRDVSFVLAELEKTHPILSQNTKIEKIWKVENLYVLSVSKKTKKIFDQHPEIKKDLEEKLGGKVVIFPNFQQLKDRPEQALRAIFSGFPIMGIDQDYIYGYHRYTIRLKNASTTQDVTTTLEELKQLAQKLLNLEVTVNIVS